MEDYYTVLGLSTRRNDPGLNPQDVRKAYRQALLKYHPDKIESDHRQTQNAATNSVNAHYTIDQITAALSILSDPTSRAEYDQKLRLVRQSEQATRANESARFFSGLDVADLDDLDYDEDKGIWRRSCRCGQDEGFIITEDDLDAAATTGELVIGCRGCSLWLKVLFQLAPEDRSHN